MDTAQPVMAAETDPNVALADAAQAFKAFDNPSSVQPRAPDGKFAKEAQAEPEDEEEEEAGLAESEPEDEGEADEDEQEAADEAQPMPPSWPADKAEIWSALPAETQAFIAERDAEQLRAVNAKFQESANARKEAEAAREQANANRDKLASELDVLMSAINPVQPDPRAFGYGTGQFNEAAYNVAMHEYQQEAGALAQLKQQREAIAKEREQEEATALQTYLDSHNQEWAPKFAELVPEIKDPAKAGPLVNAVFQYAQENGVDPSHFSQENVAHIPLAHVLTYWKAMKYDELVSSQGGKPKPKPASPAVRPGVSSPRSAQKAARTDRAKDRLAREGSIEAGAAVFKQLFKG